MKKSAPVLNVLALLTCLILLVVCQEPGYRIAFENNGKFTDWVKLQVTPGNTHVRVVGWGDFVNDEYELRLVFQIEKGSEIGDLELHLDSLRVTYNNTAMDVIESESMNGGHLITQRKERFNVAYHTAASWELLPRDEKGIVPPWHSCRLGTESGQIFTLPLAHSGIGGG